MDMQQRFAPTPPAVRIQPMSLLENGTSPQFADWQQQQQQLDEEQEDDDQEELMLLCVEEQDDRPVVPVARGIRVSALVTRGL